MSTAPALTVLEEATAIIDSALREICGRDIVTTSEMSDILLDARQKLVSMS